MKGALHFEVDPLTQNIQVKADLTEMTDFDLLRIATALSEQSFKILILLIQKKVKEAEVKQIITEASELNRKMNGN